jgi:hypothetical protein
MPAKLCCLKCERLRRVPRQHRNMHLSTLLHQGSKARTKEKVYTLWCNYGVLRCMLGLWQLDLHWSLHTNDYPWPTRDYRMVINTGVYPARKISVVGACSMFLTVSQLLCIEMFFVCPVSHRNLVCLRRSLHRTYIKSVFPCLDYGPWFGF